MKLQAVGAIVALGISVSAFASERIINGIEIPTGRFPEVIVLKTNNAACSATLVGPEVLLTAAHCGPTDAVSTATINGKDYTGKLIRSPKYGNSPEADNDVAVVILDTKVKGVRPIAINTAEIKVGDVFTHMGYGCTVPGGAGGNDGKLRMGNSAVIELGAFDAISRTPNGAALCFGDSGGPSLKNNGKDYEVVGIASKGNIVDTNYSARLDIQDSKDFLKSVVDEHLVAICGINLKC